MVWKPDVFHGPVSKEPAAIAEVTVGISHVRPELLVGLLPLNHPTARKTIPFGLLSARAAPAASSAASTATTSIPRPTIRLSLLLTPSTPKPAHLRGGSPSPHPSAPRPPLARSPRDTRRGRAHRPTSCRTAWRARPPPA